MKLSDIAEKTLYAGQNPRGVCKGIAISLKTHAVKYLLCATLATQSTPDFAVAVSAIASVREGILLNRLRPVYPKNCAKLSIGLPIYSFEGGFLGILKDVSIKDFIATRLETDRGESYPITAIVSCSDAVILRKEQPYPLGQRIPAPLLPLLTDKSEAVVTKSVLRSACAKGALVKLTLSLPPFSIHTVE
jgi:hypothetical protein